MGIGNGLQFFSGGGVSKGWIKTNVTEKLKNAYYNENVIMLEKFSQILDWTVVESSGLIAEAVTDVLLGKEGIRIYCPGSLTSAVQAHITANRTLDLSDVDGVWLIIDNKYATTATLSLLFCNATDLTTSGGYLEMPAPYSSIVHGLSSTYLPKTDFNSFLEGTFTSDLLSWRIKVLGAPVIKDYVLHGIAVGRSTPKVLFWFDDGWSSAYTIGHIQAHKRNIPLNHALIATRIDTDGFMTTAQIQDMISNSSDYMGLHGNLQWGDDPSKIAIERQGLLDTGLSDCLHSVAPNGNMGVGYGATTTISALKSAGVLTNAASISGAFLPKYQNLHAIPRTVLGNTTVTSAGAISAIDKAITGGGTVIFNLHRIGSDSTSMDLAESEYTTILDYVDKKRSAGLIDCVTIKDWYDNL